MFLDNLPLHKVVGVFGPIYGGVGVYVWFLPAYSPDLNSIEFVWSKVEVVLRRLTVRNCAKITYEKYNKALPQHT